MSMLFIPRKMFLFWLCIAISVIVCLFVLDSGLYIDALDAKEARQCCCSEHQQPANVSHHCGCVDKNNLPDKQVEAIMLPSESNRPYNTPDTDHILISLGPGYIDQQKPIHKYLYLPDTRNKLKTVILLN